MSAPTAAVAPQHAGAERVDAASGARPVARRLTTVLLAEDEATIRTMVCHALELHGCRVLAAEDGARALAIFREERDAIDVVVLDVRMPNMEGPQALAAMRALRPSLPAILVSGLRDSSGDLAALAQAGVRVVPKPYRVAELGELIDAMALASVATGAGP